MPTIESLLGRILRKGWKIDEMYFEDDTYYLSASRAEKLRMLSIEENGSPLGDVLEEALDDIEQEELYYTETED